MWHWAYTFVVLPIKTMFISTAFILLRCGRKYSEKLYSQNIMSEEEVLDENTWPKEAEAAISDISKHVKTASVSHALKSNNQRIYINLTTLEQTDYCIEMSGSGFRVVGRKYDDTSLSALENMNYETPYALLNSVSEMYRQSFGGELMTKLLILAKETNNGETAPAQTTQQQSGTTRVEYF